MLVKLYKMIKVPFHLIGTKGFHVKAENEKNLLLWANTVIRTSNLKIENFIKEMHLNESCMGSVISSSIHQSYN